LHFLHPFAPLFGAHRDFAISQKRAAYSTTAKSTGTIFNERSIAQGNFKGAEDTSSIVTLTYKRVNIYNVRGTKRDWRHYRGQCDYFAVYSAELGKVYLVSVEEVETTRAHLRLEPSKNRQEKNVRWAKDFEL